MSLKQIHWRVLVVWECQVKDQVRLRARLKKFLGDMRGSARAR